MLLTLEQLRSITCGAVDVRRAEDGFHFYRFTDEQMTMYEAHSADFFTKAHSTANIRLSFSTDSSTLGLSLSVDKGSSRTYFSFDVCVNGQPVGYLDNFSHAPLPENYTAAPFALGHFEKTFDLGEGEKAVTVYFPWSVVAQLEAVTLDDGASLTPLRPEKKMLLFGDSITHGYDALRPSLSYANRLCDALGLEGINKGIGAEIFNPALGGLRDPFEPELITVAYGTNDWSKCTAEAFAANCRGFYSALSGLYPSVKIFALTPIWRADHEDYRPFGPFPGAADSIRTCTADLPNVTVIPGFDLVPKDPAFFADKSLHPNDEGFSHYFRNLLPLL